ncbi:MAG: hypothetical protein ACTSQB_03130, partial [Candidatus Heimdallarchaeota archaeon]
KYSPIDYLVQRFGTEFYAGESSFVTFNQGEYIVDLEIPEAIPFAATYRTACKSFSVDIPEVGIERQDGQIMDYEVFSMPTAFVLNSWGNFYRIVDKEMGDVFVEPIGVPQKKPTVSEEPPKEIGTMVYPPKLEDNDIIEVAKKLVEATPFEGSEVDKITQNYVDTSFPDKEEEEQPEEFLTQPMSEETTAQPQYPWERDANDESELETTEETISDEIAEPIESLESLMNEISIDDEIEEEAFGDAEADLSAKEFADIKEALTPIDEPVDDIPETEPAEPGLIIEPSVVEEVFQGIMVEEEKELFIRNGPIDQSEPIQTSESLDPDEEVEDDAMVFYDEEDDVLEQEEPIVSEDEQPLGEESISDLPLVESDEVILEAESLEVVQDDEIITLGAPTIETEDQEALDSSMTLDLPIVDGVDEEQTDPIKDDLSLDERLALRNKELQDLKESYKVEDKIDMPKIQRWISIDYYKRMYPQKIYPLTVKIPPSENPESVDEDLVEVKLRPILPGCYITPQEEIIDLTDSKMTIVEFNVTPLIRRGKINGKLGLVQDHKGMLSIKMNSKVVSPFWPIFTTILAILFGGLPLLLNPLIDLNTRLASAMNDILSPTALMGIEFGIIGVLLAITIGLLFGLKPIKQSIKRKFFSNNQQNEE